MWLLCFVRLFLFCVVLVMVFRSFDYVLNKFEDLSMYHLSKLSGFYLV